jgi:nucleoside-diphosphate-sugar epimerase
MESPDMDTVRPETIAIFGATGTAGDGVLKAAMNDPVANKIHVITRRTSPRIEAGVAAGTVQLTIHDDFLDYSSLREMLMQVDAVYWALGTSAVNVTQDEYRVIHVDFPVNMATEWMGCRQTGEMSFHLVSGMSVSEDSRMMWAREKARAELSLFDLADGTNMRVVSYRPAYIVPTEEQANIGHNVLHMMLAPLKFALRATLIGEAMLEIGVRGNQIRNGTILENRDIDKLSNEYHQRLNPSKRA